MYNDGGYEAEEDIDTPLIESLTSFGL